MKHRNIAKSAIPPNPVARHVAKVLLCDIVPIFTLPPVYTSLIGLQGQRRICLDVSLNQQPLMYPATAFTKYLYGKTGTPGTYMSPEVKISGHLWRMNGHALPEHCLHLSSYMLHINYQQRRTNRTTFTDSGVQWIRRVRVLFR
jgi:hypothetical protein